MVGPLAGVIGAGLTEEGDTFPTERERILRDQCEKQAVIIQCLQNRLKLQDQELSRLRGADFNGMSRSSEVLLFSLTFLFSFLFLSSFVCSSPRKQHSLALPTLLQLHTQPVTGENEALSAQGKRTLSLSEVNGEPQPSETLLVKAVNDTKLILSENPPIFQSLASSLIPPFPRSSLLILFLFSSFSSQTKRAILQQLREMDATKTLCKKFAVFGFYLDTEEDDGHGDGDDEMPQDLPFIVCS